MHDAIGLRLFGGHTPRVTGAQVLAAVGIEVNTIRILARHSGEAILRYVAEAPLRSLRADLGLGSLPGGNPTRATLYAKRFSIDICIGARASPKTRGITAAARRDCKHKHKTSSAWQRDLHVRITVSMSRTRSLQLFTWQRAATMGTLYADGGTPERANVGLGCRIA